MMEDQDPEENEKYQQFLFETRYNVDEEGQLEESIDHQNIQKHHEEDQQLTQSRMAMHDERWAADNDGAEPTDQILNLNPVRALGNFKRMLSLVDDEQAQQAVQHHLQASQRQNSQDLSLNRNRGNRMRLRTIARDMTQMYMEDENGEQITYEEWEYRNKYLNFKQYKWDQKNPIDDLVSDTGMKLATYRQEARGERKGIIQFVHGYGDSVHNYAFLANMLSLHGYETCGFDQQGFGYSEGNRGVIQGLDDTQNDVNAFQTRYNQIYNQNEQVPVYLIGNSLGGLISSFVAAQKRIDIRGLCLTVPFFGLHTQPDLHNLANYGFLSTPNFKMTTKNNKKHLQDWYQDHLNLSAKEVDRESFLANLQAMERLKAESGDYSNIDLPTLVLAAGKDTTVSNSKIEEFYEAISSEDKQIITYDEVDHQMFLDAEYMPLAVKDITAWLDVHN